MDLEPLLRPFQLKGLTIPNRITMAPMTRAGADNHIPTEAVAQYYRKRTEGGTGLLITEGIGVDHPAALGDDSGGFAHQIPVLHGEKAVAGWRNVVDQVHEAGGCIFPQLWHQGVFRVEGTGSHPDAPSARPSGVWGPMGRSSVATEEYLAKVAEPTAPMTEQAIADVIAGFASSARHARQAGFDGIALHGANGYLIDTFFWPETNFREDRYGGEMAARATIGIELVRAVREAIGPDMPILFRFSQWKLQDFTARNAQTPEELGVLLGGLSDAGVDMFDACTHYFNEPAFEGSDLPLAAWAKKLTSKPSMAVGGVGLAASLFTSLVNGGADIDNNFIEAAERIDRGEFDMIALGRALLADADWLNKVRAGQPTVPFTRDMLGILV